MKSIAQKFIAVREFIAKLFWLSAISLVATGLVATATAGAAFADASDAEAALAQLMQDISSLQEGLEQPVMVSQNGYYKTRLGDTLSQIISALCPMFRCAKKFFSRL